MNAGKSMGLLLLLVTAKPVFAQYDYASSNSGGGIVYYGAKQQTVQDARGDFGITTTPSSEGVDPHSKYYVLYPMSVKKPQTSLEYYPGAQKIDISFSFDTAYCRISDMRYSITDMDTTVNTGWRVLPAGRWVPQGGSRTILFANDFDCRDKVLFIKLYNINNPESVITQIVNTRILEAPLLQCGGTSDIVLKNAQKSKNKKIDDFLKQIKMVELKGKVRLNTAENFRGLGITIHTKNYPFFFRGYLIRDMGREKDTVDLALNWEPVTDMQLYFWARMGGDIKPLPRPSYTAEIPAGLINNGGKYTLLVTTADYRDKNSRANLVTPVFASTSFEISRPYMFRLRDVLWGAGVAGAALLALFLFLKYRQRKKIQAEKQAAREAKLSLQAVQSQLNPHFIFNALAGIQNLLHKQENEKANAYLTTFSRLTRSVLNDAEKELIPLNDEIKLLNDYLQMEQLRFGFTYSVETGNGIDTQNTEIPPMLLQPFVENAVKHGVASIKQEGKILIKMYREENDLIIEVKDNGKGFSSKRRYDGKGLVLSENRISLLNTLYGDIFGLDVSSGLPGAIVTLKIKSWLK
ncbi:sensor histidine kinase [Niabella aquatica]